MNLDKIEKFFIFLAFVLFLYSGSIKTLISLPIDPTVLFGVILVTYMGYKILRRKVLGKTQKIISTLLFVLFFVWILVSCMYTQSENYYLDKLLRTILLFVSFVFPLVVIKSHQDVRILRGILMAYSLVVLVVLIGVYWLSGGNLSLYFEALSRRKTQPMDYLALGEIIGLLIFIIWSKKDVLHIGIKVIAFLMLILLGGRGPFIFTLLVFFIYLLKKSKFDFKTFGKMIGIVAFFPFLFYIFLQWEGSTLLFARFESVGHGDYSLKARQGFVEESVKILAQGNLIQGIGYGGFGMAYFNKDIRAYPHNIFLEILVELGVVGLFLFLIFLGNFYWQSFRKLFVHEMEGVEMDFVLAFIFLFLQTMKSNSFIDIRPLFAFIGVIICLSVLKKKELMINKDAVLS